ncbi:MAG: ABC transporter permease [Bacteroidota bacterium]|jgi:putative ABC transport system permease protein
MILELLKEFFHDLRTQRTRAFLTLLAVTWGTVSVMLLLAFGEGLGNRLTAGLLNAGNRILIVYGGETSIIHDGLPKGRRVRFTEEDISLLRESIPGIAMISPQYRGNVSLTYGKKTTTTECEGVNPDFEEMRRMFPAGGGRFINESDVLSQRRTLFIGIELAEELFGSENPVGKVVMMDAVPFTVVGVMQKKIQTSMNNGPDTWRAIIPYTTFHTRYGNLYVNSIVIRPTDPSQQARLKENLSQFLGSKYHFAPEDERALFIWDFLEAEKINNKVSMGIEIFLGSVGFLTLLIAGVGVANVMFAVVKERTREIGIKMAIGARKNYILAQFIFEALSIAFIGGTIGIMITWAIVFIVHLFPADSGPMQFLGRPVISTSIMFLTVGILALVGLLAGFFPARRAANVDPVESLRYE